MNQKQFENLYHVLIRNKQLRFSAYVEFNEPKENMEAVVKWSEEKFPQQYLEALKICSDPNRKIIQMYEDEMDFFTECYKEMEEQANEYSTEVEDYLNIFNYYLDDKNRRAEFMGFLHEVKKEVEESGESYWGDIDWHIKQFEE